MTFIAKDSYDKQELLDCGQGELFGDGNGRLPTPNMLMFDRINHISSEGGEFKKGKIIAELDIDPSLWFFYAILKRIQLCLGVLVLMLCGNW